MKPLSAYMDQRLHERRRSGETLLMTHVVYGYPSVDESLALMEHLLEQGVAFLEVQFPFSDPVADGPAIVNACHRALENGPLPLVDCLESLGKLQRRFRQSRIVLMSYLNPLYRFGLTKLVDSCAEQGITGLIIPDLPLEQAGAFRQDCEAAGISPIWMVTPATPISRLKVICEAADGLLYCVSRAGVTGSNPDAVQRSQEDYLQAVKTLTATPLALGFGIRSAAQVREASQRADVVVLGSVLLDAFTAGGIPAVDATLKQLVAEE
ncbi:tryptophan synthase subunit alpha [Pokkaliibacter sp. CJK22405]|uniref:tryptophan synthase subunit alpha n=1 Tax=Pokkaliibacter sp. CJK22405 TaxID=3384615 RepID=UPI003984C7C9